MKKTAPWTATAIFLIAVCALPASAKPENQPKSAAQKAHAKAGQAHQGRSGAKAPVLYATRPEAMDFADDLATRRDLDREWVRQAIGQAHFLPQVPRLMLPPAKGTAKNWRVYRSRFIDPIRIRAGVRFWQENQATLERAEREFGVPDRKSTRLNSSH